MKHIYLHTSNLDYIKDINEDLCFEPAYLYPIHEIQKKNPHDYGRIKTSFNYYHIILGKVLQKNCPWCGNTPFLKEKKIDSLCGVHDTYFLFYMECPFCFSRGPVLNVDIKLYKTGYSHCVEITKSRYADRIPWDKDLLKEEIMNDIKVK